jgi:hypothetical protein
MTATAIKTKNTRPNATKQTIYEMSIQNALIKYLGDKKFRKLWERGQAYPTNVRKNYMKDFSLMELIGYLDATKANKKLNTQLRRYIKKALFEKPAKYLGDGYDTNLVILNFKRIFGENLPYPKLLKGIAAAHISTTKYAAKHYVPQEMGQ